MHTEWGKEAQTRNWIRQAHWGLLFYNYLRNKDFRIQNKHENVVLRWRERVLSAIRRRFNSQVRVKVWIAVQMSRLFIQFYHIIHSRLFWNIYCHWIVLVFILVPRLQLICDVALFQGGFFAFPRKIFGALFVPLLFTTKKKRILFCFFCFFKFLIPSDIRNWVWHGKNGEIEFKYSRKVQRRIGREVGGGKKRRSGMASYGSCSRSVCLLSPFVGLFSPILQCSKNSLCLPAP